MMTSLMICGSMPAREIAARAAMTPRSTALKFESAPMNLPTGVRAPARMTASVIHISFQKNHAIGKRFSNLFQQAIIPQPRERCHYGLPARCAVFAGGRAAVLHLGLI